MRVQFEFTQADLIDASTRFLSRSKVASSWGSSGQGSAAFFAGLLVLLFFIRTPLTALIGLLAAAIAGLIYPAIQKRTIEKRQRALLKAKLGEANSFVCEVELTPVGVWVRQMNTQITHEWESVAEIAAKEDSVDIFTKEGEWCHCAKQGIQITRRPTTVY